MQTIQVNVSDDCYNDLARIALARGDGVAPDLVAAALLESESFKAAILAERIANVRATAAATRCRIDVLAS